MSYQFTKRNAKLHKKALSVKKQKKPKLNTNVYAMQKSAFLFIFPPWLMSQEWLFKEASRCCPGQLPMLPVIKSAL